MRIVHRSAALAVNDCRDLNGLVALQANLATAYAESVMRYARTFAELAQQTNAEVAKLLTGRYEEWNRLMRGAMPAVGSGARPAIGRAAMVRASLRMSRTPLSRRRQK